MSVERRAEPLRLKSRSWGWVLSALMFIGAAAPSAWGGPIDLGASSLRMFDLSGRLHVLAEREGCRATVLVFLSTECPIARSYIPELNRLFASYPPGKVDFFGVFSDRSLTRAGCVSFIQEFAISFPVLFDASGELADRLQPTHVPEAFVLNPQRAVVYRGRIDDVFREVGRRQLSATTHDLDDAVRRELEGKGTGELVQTSAVGCPHEQNAVVSVTYHRDISPLVKANCTECHRPGAVAPFALESYEDCSKRGAFLWKVVQDRLMPPWMASPGHGEFIANRLLSERQKKLVADWVEQGMPEGNTEDALGEVHFPGGWQLGEPDVVLESPHEVTVPADGDDIFQHYVIPIDLPEDKTLIGYEFQPGNPAVVHHAVVFYDAMGAGRKKDEKSPEPGYRTFGSPGIAVSGVVGVWAPGMTPRFLPDDIGFRLPRKVDLVLQLHLHPSGKVEKDRSKIGLHFAKRGQERSRVMSRVPLVLGTLMIDVPPGESKYDLYSETTLPVPITLMSVLPHMHLIGKEMKVTAHLPTGEEKPLIWIKDWNFYWQDNYAYRQPVDLPAGTRLTIRGIYDNSESNPHNPSRPPKRVLFGNDSDEEMFLCVFQTVSHSAEAEKAIGTSLLKSFQDDWKRPAVRPDARPRIISEAIEFLGGGEVLLKMLLKPGASPITANGG